MTRVLFLGDTHGDLEFLALGLEKAVEEECQVVVQLGDFGFLWPDVPFHKTLAASAKGDRLAKVESLCEDFNMPLVWIDGNHDWHPEIRARYPVMDLNVTTRGFVQGPDESYIRHLRRGSRLRVEGDSGDHTITIVGFGGAPSIDRAQRIPEKSWWPEEEITTEDLDAIPAEWVDVLASHDAPCFPPGFGPIGRADFDARGASSAAFVRRALRVSKARLNVHGHWHKRYARTEVAGVSHRVAVEGLDCNSGPFKDTYLVVDKNEDRQMTWQSRRVKP